MEQHDDDKPVGRVLSRREILMLLGGAGAALIAGSAFTKFDFDQATGTAVATEVATESALPSCVVRPALTEGPYFVDELLNRSDIRSDPTDGTVKDGVPLRLTFRVLKAESNACAPLEGAQVDIWHCDAVGVYSDVQDRSFNTKGKKFLRGYQVTDSSGTAEFMTIYPGWYSGRAVHIHFKIRTDPASQTGYEFTSQLFFDDKLSDEVETLKPYATKGKVRDTRNSDDGIYQNGGDQSLLTLKKEGNGYAATFDIALDTSQTQPQGGNAPGGPGPRPGGTPPATP
jgi:protocatechuate 3,4-dioxygenase beta subunit